MKKRIIIVIAAMVILCGVLTGIGILMSVQKPEKKSEQKSEKVEQELQTKLEEKQKIRNRRLRKHKKVRMQQKTEEEPLSMELSGIKRRCTFYDGNFQKRSGRCTENLDTGTWIFQCHRSTVFGADAGTIFRRKIHYGLQLIFADGGNGIQPEDVQTKLTMDYFKEKKLLQIHK